MLTKRQQEILDFIREHQRVRGVTPSTREIQEHLGLASQTTVVDHLKALENKGVLKKLSNTARGLVLTDRYAGSEMREIPIYGTIPAGFPADQQQEAEGCGADRRRLHAEALPDPARQTFPQGREPEVSQPHSGP